MKKSLSFFIVLVSAGFSAISMNSEYTNREYASPGRYSMEYQNMSTPSYRPYKANWSDDPYYNYNEITAPINSQTLPITDVPGMATKGMTNL